MKKLSELYPGVSQDVMIKSIKINSKECKDGDLFVCTGVWQLCKIEIGI